MNTEKRFFVGDIVEIVGSDNTDDVWVGFQALVEPWPEHEEQFVDGLIHNWLMPLSNRPDGFQLSNFMWPTKHLKKVG